MRVREEDTGRQSDMTEVGKTEEENVDGEIKGIGRDRRERARRRGEDSVRDERQRREEDRRRQRERKKEEEEMRKESHPR